MQQLLLNKLFLFVRKYDVNMQIILTFPNPNVWNFNTTSTLHPYLAITKFTLRNSISHSI